MLIGALHYKILIYSWNQSVFFLSRQGVFQWTMLLFPESSPLLYSALILLNCLLVLHTQGFFIKRRLYSGFLIWLKCFLFNLIEVFSLTKFFLSLFNTKSNIKAMRADKKDLDIHIFIYTSASPGVKKSFFWPFPWWRKKDKKIILIHCL